MSRSKTAALMGTNVAGQGVHAAGQRLNLLVQGAATQAGELVGQGELAVVGEPAYLAEGHD